MNLPRYGLEAPRMYSCGSSSGMRTPSAGFSIIHIVAATTEIATCIVVAFWCGTRRLDSSMLRSEPTHHDLKSWPMMSAPRMSAPADLVVHDAQPRLELVAAAAQL